MTLFPAITITDATPFVFKRHVHKPNMSPLRHLIAWVDSGSGTVYVGNVPDPAFDIVGLKVTSGSNLIGKTMPDHAHLNFHMVKPGYVWSCVDDGSDDGNYVVGVDRDLIEFRDAFTFDVSGGTGTFTPPDVTSTNGIPIAEGNHREWVTGKDNRFLSYDIKFVVEAAATATLRLGYDD